MYYEVELVLHCPLLRSNNAFGPWKHQRCWTAGTSVWVLTQFCRVSERPEVALSASPVSCASGHAPAPLRPEFTTCGGWQIIKIGSRNWSSGAPQTFLGWVIGFSSEWHWLSLWSSPYSTEKNVSPILASAGWGAPGASGAWAEQCWSLLEPPDTYDPAKGSPATMPYRDTGIQEGTWNQGLSKFYAQSQYWDTLHSCSQR